MLQRKLLDQLFVLCSRMRANFPSNSAIYNMVNYIYIYNVVSEASLLTSVPFMIPFFVFAEYKLVGFISHMGTSTHVGHYVCHILKDGRWVIFNDEKVALSKQPPKDLAYLYLYQRV